MALPKLNSATYATTIPSTNKKITFRPYLVKEEKILMMALESKDQEQIIRATKELISSCVTEDIDVNKLATFDVEHLFLQLRSKSVGESIGLKVKCEHCNSENDVLVDVTDINVDILEDNNVIMITDTVGVKMRYPSFNDVSSISESNEESIETAFNIIVQCIESIFDADEVYSASREGEAAIKNFIESLNSEQFKNIAKFFDTLPALTSTIDFNCSSCNKDNSSELRGLQSFFI